MALSLFFLCSIIWGLTWISIKMQFGAADPSTAVFYRFLVSALLMWGYCKIKNLPMRFNKKDHLVFLGQGFFMFFLNYQLTYWASQMAPSAIVALAFTMLIYFNMFGAKIFFKTQIESKVFWGAAVSVSGLGLMLSAELTTTDYNSSIIFGFLISFVATFSASAGNLISNAGRKRKLNIFTNNMWGMFYGSLFSLVYCLATFRSFSVQFSSTFVWSFVYLTVFGTVISFAAYLKLIDLLGPAKAALTSVLSPAIAFVVSALFENLTLTPYLILGVALCLVGNTIALTPKSWLRFHYK